MCVAAGKSNGLIIDYIGIVRALKKALNDYTRDFGGTKGVDSTIDKGRLIDQIVQAAADAAEEETPRYGGSDG